MALPTPPQPLSQAASRGPAGEASSTTVTSSGAARLPGEPGAGRSGSGSRPQSLCSVGRTDAASSPVICSPDTRWRSENHKEDKFWKGRPAPALQLLERPWARTKGAVGWESSEDAVSPTPDSKGTSGHLPSALFLCSLPPSPQGGRTDPMDSSCTRSQLLTPASLLLRERPKKPCRLRRPMKSHRQIPFAAGRKATAHCKKRGDL